MSKAFAEANARKKKQQQQQDMTKEQRYEQTFVDAVNSRARERDNAVRSVQNLSQQIADNDRTGAYKGTLTDQHRRVNDLSSLRTQLQNLRRNFGLDIGDTSDIDNAIKQQTKFVNAFKNDGEYRTGYWFGEKYKGSNKQQVQSAISSLEKGNDAQKGEALWLKQNQYQYWNSADLQKQMEANLAEAKRLQSLVNEVHGNAKSNRMKQYGDKIDSLKSEANAIRRALEAKAKEKEIMKLAPSEREMLTKYGEAAAKEDAYMSVSSANPVSRLIANASLPKETKKVIEDTEKMLRKKGYTPEQIRTLRDYSVKDYNAKSVQAQAEAIQKFADKSGWAKVLASAGAIAADYVGGVQGVSDIVGQNLFGGKDAFTGNKRSVDYNSMFQQTGLAGEALKAGVTQDMGEFGKWAYGAGLSTIESLIGVYGMPGRTYELLMSGMAAQSAMQEMHRRGVDDGRVLGVGLAAGGLEALFEHASIENLRGIINAQKATGSGIKGAIERGLLQAGVEASEEGFTSLANTATELLALGDKSELKSNIKLYQQQGMSEEEATRKAGMEWLDSVLQDTAAGFASGGASTVIPSIGFAVNEARAGQAVIDKTGETDLIKEALSFGEKSPAYKVAQGLKDQLAEAQKNKTDVKLSKPKLGELFRKVEEQKRDDANSERAKIERQLPQTHESVFVDPVTGDTTVGVKASRVAEALIASGESASVAVAKAPIIEKIVAGKEVTDAELKKMGVFSAAVAKVVNTYTLSDIDPTNASESELIKAYHAAAAQQKTRIDETVKLGEDIKAARAKLEAAQAEGEARLAEQEAALDEETQAAAAELAQSEPEQEQQSGSVIKVTNGDGTQVDMTLQDYIDSARQVNPDDPRSDAELAEEFNTLLGHAAMNGGTVRAEDVPNILRGASEASVAAEETPATEEEETTAEEEEEPAAEEGTGEEETKPKEEPAAEEPEAPVEDAPKEKRPLGDEIAKDIYFLQEEGNEVKELTEEQIWAMQIAMPLLRQAGIKNLVVDETATAGANAFIDDGDGTIRINPKQMKSQIMILRILAHEIVHPATNDRNGKQTDMAERIIDSFVAMYKQGVLTGKLEKLVEAYINGKAVPDYKDDYKEFTGHDVSDHYAKQEIASDMVGLVGDSRPMLEKLVGYQPDLMTKILRKLNTRRNGITIRTIKDDDQRKATQQALDQIATDINNALRKSKLAAFQPKTKAQERADQRAEKLAAKAQKQNADRVSRVKERARTADTGESVAESTRAENKSVAKAMERLNKGANRTRTARASLGLFPKDSNEHRAIEALGSGAEVTTNGDDELVLAKSKDNHTIMYSHATLYGIGDYYEAHPEAKSGIELLKQTLKANGHTDSEIAEVVKGIESLDKELGDLSEQIYQKYGWDEMKEHYAMEIVTDLRDAQQVIYTLTPNGEYPVNLDLALVCKKRVAYTRVLAQLVRDGVLDEISFGAEAIAKVNEILRDAGFETACLGCFVESRRTAIQNWAEDFVFEWNKVVDGIDPNAGYFNFTYTNNPETGERENEVPALSLKDVAALDKMYEHNILNKQGNVSFSSSGPLDKVIELFHEKRDSDVLLKKLRPADLMTPEGIAAIKRTDKTLFNLAKGRYGAAQPKVLQSFHPYAGDMTNATFEEVTRKTGKDFEGVNQKSYRNAAKELIKRKPGEDKNAYEIRMRELGVANLNGKEDKDRRIDALAMRLYLYDIGGARIQSFSDFMIENTLDYLQIIADMSAARLPMHGYTKEIIAMKLFGMTGLKWNGSLIAHVDPAEDKNHAGLLPVSEASDGRGIILTGPARVENGKAIGEKQWAICFDDYDRNQRTGKPAKEYLAAHGGVVKNLTEAQKAEYKRLKKQESYIQSIGMKDIFALMMDPRYSKNIGNITIGVSDVQIIAMLRSDLFTMVIPYHKSGLPKIFAELMGIENYNNYEDFQKTTVKQVYDENGKPIKGFIYRGGKAVHANTEAFNFNEALQRHKGNARAAAKDYIKWCKQKHPIIRDKKTIGYETFNPKFSSSPNGFNFAEDPLTRDYYYKLLEDFTALDPVTGKWTPQGAVQQYKVKKDGTYDLSKPLLPSESNRLTDEQKDQYRERLRGIGIYTEEEIGKIIQKSDMTFGELVQTEAENRGHYHHEVDPKFDGTYEEILEALSDPELRGTRAERDAERQSEIDKKAAEKAKKAAKKAAAAEARMSLPSDLNEMDEEYLAAVERGDKETYTRMFNEWMDRQVQETFLPDDADEVGYKYHRGKTPAKTVKRYIVMSVRKGAPHASYIASGNPTPFGVWLDAQMIEGFESDKQTFKDGSSKYYVPGGTGADWKKVFSPERYAEMKASGQIPTVYDNNGKPTSPRWLLQRGGKHGALFADFSQMNSKTNEAGEKVESGKLGALPSNKLIFEVEFGIDEDGDLTEYVKEHGRMDSKGNQGLSMIEPNQFYDYKTNPNDVGAWVIGSTFRITRLVPHDEIVRSHAALQEYERNEAKRRLDEKKITQKQYEKLLKKIEEHPVQKWVGGYHPENYDLSVEKVAKMVTDGMRKKTTDPVTYDNDGSVIPLSQRFDPNKNDLRYSIAGENSILADTDELDVAKNMEAAGNNADQIRIVTGWYRGPDGKWRYEIDDSRMQFHEKGSAKIWNDYPDYKDFYELEQKVKRGDSLTAEEQAWFDKAKKKFEPLREKLNKEGRDHIRNGTATLDEVLVHPELFAAYPDLRSVKFRVTDMSSQTKPGEILWGQHDSSQNLITLNKNAPWTTKAQAKDYADQKRKEREERKKQGLPIEPVSPFADLKIHTMRSTLLHEVQHAIQSIEGFAKGTDTSYWEGLMKQSARSLKAWKQGLSQRSSYAGAMLRNWEAALKHADIGEMERIENDLSSAAYDPNNRSMTPEILHHFFQVANAVRLDSELRSDFDLYWDTVGEREARDTQQRINLTPAQRRRYHPDLGDRPVFAESDYADIYRPSPNNKTWNKPSGTGVRYSLPSDPAEMDHQYMDAVESGDMEAAQAMVDEAAARAGYTVRTYHGTPQEMLSAAKGRVSGDEYKALERDYADKLFPFVVFRNSPHHAGIYTATDRGVAEDFSFSFSKAGTVFDLYARAENPIVVDAGKNGWNNIPAAEAERIGLTPDVLQELREAHPKTRNKKNIFIDDLVEFAKSRGYDSVIVENVRETGFGDEFSPLTTDVVVLDSSQLKSADPITYDDEGNVIPLSERFNPENDDIRFSLNPDLFLTDDYKTYYQELFSDKGLSPEAVKKARANARDENTSRIATTYKNFFDANERRRKGLRKGDLGYVPDTNAESMQRAQDRLDADFQGEYENLKKNGLNTDDDVDAAMGILNVLVTDARNTKDYKDVADWLQRIRANATRSGQIVQAFAKYAQTPEGILIEAEEILAQTDLSKADQGIILAQLAQFATTLNAIKKGEEGNRDDLIDLILDQAAIRNTKVSNQTLKDLYRQKIDFLYDAALNQMSQIAQDYLKPSLAKGAATYQTISHLFNVRTAARNVVSNTVFSPVAAVANNLAVVPDIIISLFTKQKTVGFDRWWFSGKTWKGVEEGARRAHVEIALDIDPRPNSRDKYGTSRRTWKMTGNAASRVGSTIEKAMGFELNWTDEFHKGAVEAEILQSLQGLVDKGVIREEDAEEWARQEALYRSFQDDTFLSARLQDIKNLLNTVGFGHTGRYLGAKAQTPFNEIKEFGLGDLIQKYTQVPGALITRAIEFSPIGYVKMIANLAQMKNVNKALRTAEMRLQEAQDELDQEPDSAALINRVFQAQKSVDSARFKAQSKQRMAALAMGRATTGVGLIKAFAMLAASGLLHRPDDDDDPDATAMLQSMGVTGTQLNVSALARKLKGEDASWKKGDQLWAIDFLEPLNGLMTIGTKIIKEAKDDKTFKDKLDSAQRGTIDGLWNVIGEIPTMQSFSTIQQTLRYYDPEQWPNRATAVGIELARGSVTGFIPSLIRQTAQATDTVQRNTYTSKKPLEMTKDQIQNTLPYFRKKLPAKLDNYGQPRKQENPLLNVLNAYVIPGSIRTYQVSPEAKELASVSKKTGDVNIYPDRNPPSKITVSVDGEDYSYNLSAKQKQTYQSTRGKYSYQFQHDMMSDPFYKSATAQEKNAMLTEAKQLADYMAKKEFLSKQKDAPDYTDSSHEKTLGALANGYTVASWVDVRTTTNKAKGVDADGDGKADSGTKKKEQLGIIQSYDLNDTQKTYWFRGSDYNGSDSGRDYIGEAIDQHITPTKYIDAALKLLDAHGTDNNNDGKTDSGSVLKSKAAIINSLALTAEQKKWLFLQGNSKSTKFANSYNWTDTSSN